MGIPPTHPLSRTHMGVRLCLTVPVISRLKLSCMARIRLGRGECWSGTTSRSPPRCMLARQGTESPTRARWTQTAWQGARSEPSKSAPPTLTTQSPRWRHPLGRRPITPSHSLLKSSRPRLTRTLSAATHVSEIAGKEPVIDLARVDGPGGRGPPSARRCARPPPHTPGGDRDAADWTRREG